MKELQDFFKSCNSFSSRTKRYPLETQELFERSMTFDLGNTRHCATFILKNAGVVLNYSKKARCVERKRIFNGGIGLWQKVFYTCWKVA